MDQGGQIYFTREEIHGDNFIRSLKLDIHNRDIEIKELKNRNEILTTTILHDRDCYKKIIELKEKTIELLMTKVLTLEKQIS